MQWYLYDLTTEKIFLPGLDLYKVCQSLKQDERFGGNPVMLLIGSFGPFDEAEARQSWRR